MANSGELTIISGKLSDLQLKLVSGYFEARMFEVYKSNWKNKVINVCRENYSKVDDTFSNNYKPVIDKVGKLGEETGAEFSIKDYDLSMITTLLRFDFMRDCSLTELVDYRRGSLENEFCRLIQAIKSSRNKYFGHVNSRGVGKNGYLETIVVLLNFVDYLERNNWRYEFSLDFHRYLLESNRDFDVDQDFLAGIKDELINLQDQLYYLDDNRIKKVSFIVLDEDKEMVSGFSFIVRHSWNSIYRHYCENVTGTYYLPLERGKYVIECYGVPKGYKPFDTIVLDVKATDPVEITKEINVEKFVYQPYKTSGENNSVEFSVVDKHKKLISGYEIEIYNHKNEVSIIIVTTNKPYELNLNSGEYVIRCIGVPKGFEKFEEQKFLVLKNRESTKWNICVERIRKQECKVGVVEKKYISKGNGKSKFQVEYKIVDEKGQGIPNCTLYLHNYNYDSNNDRKPPYVKITNGKGINKGVYPGKYRVSVDDVSFNKDVIENYEIPIIPDLEINQDKINEPKEIVFRRKEPVQVVVGDKKISKKMSKVSFTVVDEENVGIKFCKFNLENRNPKYGKIFVKINDGKGERDLYPGKYKVTMDAKDWYEVPEIEDLIIDENGDDIEFPKIIVKKKGISNKQKSLAKIEFTVVDENNNGQNCRLHISSSITTFTTDIKIIDGKGFKFLLAGHYKIELSEVSSTFESQVIDDLVISDYENTVFFPKIVLKKSTNLNKINKIQTKECNNFSNCEISAQNYYNKGLESKITGDYVSAIEMFKKSHDEGHIEATRLLGDMYFYGYGVAENAYKAFEYYLEAAEKGDLIAAYNTGFMYFYGIGINNNPKFAQDWLSIVANNNSSSQENRERSYGFLGHICFEDKEYEQALSWYQKISNPDEQIQCKIAELTEKISSNKITGQEYCKQGLDAVNRGEFDKALKMFSKSHEQGCIEATYYLGAMYAYGKGVEQDFEKAYYYFMHAAENNNMLACYSAGLCCLNGKGTEQSHSKAIYWLTKITNNSSASEKHLNSAYETLGDVYSATGDYEKALDCYKKVTNPDENIKNKISEVEYSLGSMYAHGYLRGGEMFKDWKKAYYYFMHAAESNNVLACYNAGLCCLYGNGTEKNYSKAIYWFSKIIDNDSATEENLNSAYEALGDAYSAIGEYEEALDWYELVLPMNEKIIVELLDKTTKKELTATDYYRQAEEANAKWCYLEAFEMYTKSAELGHMMANIRLGDLYFYGRGVEKDERKAFELYMLAAENGIGEACYNIGWAYLKGRGVAEDRNKAKRWLSKVADDSTTPQNILEKTKKLSNEIANMTAVLNNTVLLSNANNKMNLFNSIPTDANSKANENAYLNFAIKNKASVKSVSPKNAEYYFNLAKEQFNKYQYRDGLDSTKKAAELGHTQAMVNLGRIYEMGELVTRDYNIALSWYQKAMDKDFADAYFNAASLYYFGYLGKTNYRKAYELCKLAADKGCVIAKKEVAKYKKAFEDKENFITIKIPRN